MTDEKRPLRVGLIGAGFMGEFHARAYASARRLVPDIPVEVAIIAEPVPSLRDEFAERWDVSDRTGDWREVIGSAEVDIVDICTPPGLHRDIALTAIAAGKHVYCEKPVGRTSRETGEIAAAARNAPVRTMVGFNYRWFPAVQHARQLIADGELGELWNVRMSFASDWASDPTAAWGWRLSAADAGYGALGDVGSHIFDMARLLAGELESVCGLLSTFVTSRRSDSGPRQVDTDDAFAAVGRFANGGIGEFSGSRVATGSKVEFRVEVVGSEGALRWEVGRLNELRRFEGSGGPDDGFRTVQLGPQHDVQGLFSPVQGLGIGFEDSKAIEVMNFLRAIDAGVAAEPNFDDAAAVASILDAVAEGTWTQPRSLTGGPS
jgi:predicted dehydrogenase